MTLGEIRSLLAWYHEDHRRIQAVNDLAYRLWIETQTAGGTRLPAESPADYPAVDFSPAVGTFSYGGTDSGGPEAEEAGP